MAILRGRFAARFHHFSPHHLLVLLRCHHFTPPKGARSNKNIIIPLDLWSKISANKEGLVEVDFYIGVKMAARKSGCNPGRCGATSRMRTACSRLGNWKHWIVKKKSSGPSLQASKTGNCARQNGEQRTRSIHLRRKSDVLHIKCQKCKQTLADHMIFVIWYNRRSSDESYNRPESA